MKALLKEFRSFAMRGNVVDLAIAVVIGGAFGKIVTSLVDSIIMPIAGLLTGGVDLSHLALTLREASDDKTAVVLGYGMFLNNIVSFLIIAFAIFIVMKHMNIFIKKEEAKPTEEQKQTKDQALLTEIRDLLKANHAHK
jgi:large conductance mechanosensitive channel